MGSALTGWTASQTAGARTEADDGGGVDGCGCDGAKGEEGRDIDRDAR